MKGFYLQNWIYKTIFQSNHLFISIFSHQNLRYLFMLSYQSPPWISIGYWKYWLLNYHIYLQCIAIAFKWSLPIFVFKLVVGIESLSESNLNKGIKMALACQVDTQKNLSSKMGLCCTHQNSLQRFSCILTMI